MTGHSIPASHDEVRLTSEIAAARTASILAREAARDAARTPAAPVPPRSSPSSARWAAPAKAAPPPPPPPAVPEGAMVLSADEVRGLQRLVATHPTYRRPPRTQTLRSQSW